VLCSANPRHSGGGARAVDAVDNPARATRVDLRGYRNGRCRAIFSNLMAVVLSMAAAGDRHPRDSSDPESETRKRSGGRTRPVEPVDCSTRAARVDSCGNPRGGGQRHVLCARSPGAVRGRGIIDRRPRSSRCSFEDRALVNAETREVGASVSANGWHFYPRRSTRTRAEAVELSANSTGRHAFPRGDSQRPHTRASRSDSRRACVSNLMSVALSTLPLIRNPKPETIRW